MNPLHWIHIWSILIFLVFAWIHTSNYCCKFFFIEFVFHFVLCRELCLLTRNFHHMDQLLVFTFLVMFVFSWDSFLCSPGIFNKQIWAAQRFGRRKWRCHQCKFSMFSWKMNINMYITAYQICCGLLKFFGQLI